MTERETYLKMAEWLRKHGFTPDYGRDRCGCFLRAAEEVAYSRIGFGCKLLNVIGAENFGTKELRAAGWTKGCTDDAVAACLIAADLAA